MEQWKEINATEFCYHITDGTHDSPKAVPEGKFLITSKHIKNDQIDFDSAYKISEEDYFKIVSRSKVDKWDIIISMIGAYCGFCYLQDNNQTDFAIKNVGLFKVGEEYKCKWLYYYLTSPQGKQQLAMMRSGSSQPYIALNSLRNLKIPCPSKEIMVAVVSILDSIDKKIRLNRQINDNLEQQAQALFKSWFVDFEPFKDGEFVDSELGMIPKGWRVGKLSDIADVTMGQSPSGESYNENGIGEIFYQGRTEFGDRFPSIRLYTTAPNRMAESNSILLSVRAPVGDINVALQKCCIGRGLASINAIDNYYSFVFYTVKSMKKDFDVYNGEGTVFGSINKDSLNNMSVIIPTDDIKSNFENIVSKLDNEYRLNHSEIVNLSNLRDTLLPRLISGELKINEINC